MNPELEKLRKILEFEKSKGYDNTSVIGGLSRYLKNRCKLLEKDSGTGLSQLIADLLNNNAYESLKPSERQRWVNSVVSQLEKITLTEELAQKPVGHSRTTKSIRKKASPGKIAQDELDSLITKIKGISKATFSKLSKLGVNSIRDLLYFFPRRHIDYSKKTSIARLQIGVEQTVVANIWSAGQVLLGRRMGTEATVGDDSGNMRVVWFNRPYIARMLATNATVVLSGRVSQFQGRPVFESPEWELLKGQDLIHTGRLIPVYRLTEGLYPRQLRKLIKATVEKWSPLLHDHLPQKTIRELKFMNLSDAVQQAHFPDSLIIKEEARRRLAFDELLFLQLGAMRKRYKWQEQAPGISITKDPSLLQKFVSCLPFKLTAAQERVLEDILGDMAQVKPMCRLLQGEVGSGKTIIATIALLTTIANNYQSAMMAPTEILAEQHFNTISNIFSLIGKRTTPEDNKNISLYEGISDRKLAIALLTSNTGKRQRDDIYQRLKEGQIDIVLGTHALIQKELDFKALALAIVDEQHRFGVMQRVTLGRKGYNPHLLVMTATPIPRSLALTLYGDLDLSVINELPPGRQRVKTRWLNTELREQAYNFIRKQIDRGGQAFIICPLIEESESIEARAATVEYKRLSSEIFPDLRLGLLHGQMPSVEKESVMRQFHNRDIDILVSTPVVEVGIDVPNATVMLIEGADRFGLSQLHQFRGRVGRGSEQSYCILLSDNPSSLAMERLKIIESTHDGFILAEEDLRLRGPGEIFGVRQSGLSDLKMARLSDLELIELSRACASDIMDEDPLLQRDENKLLAGELIRRWQDKPEDVNDVNMVGEVI